MRVDSFRELAKSDIRTDWIVENFISPGGWTFLVGEAKVGKSIWAIQLCEALELGESFFGMATRQLRCLYIQADAGLIEWKIQIERYARESMAWTAHQMKQGFLDRPRDRLQLSQLVWGDYDTNAYTESQVNGLRAALRGEGFEYIIFDCLHAITDMDINLKQNASQVLKHINEIVTRVDGENIEQKPYLLIHHPNASVPTGRTAGSGSKWFSGACTTKLTLTGNDKEKTGMLILEGGKLVSHMEIELKRTENGKWYRDDIIDKESYDKEVLKDFTDLTAQADIIDFVLD